MQMMSKTEPRRMSSGLIRTSADNTSDSSGFSFLRSNTSAGLRTIICSVGPDSIVVTPDSIPQFTIPRLAVEERYTYTAEDRGAHPGEDTAQKLPQDQTSFLHQSSSSSSSSSSLFSSSPVLSRKAQRTISDPNYHRRTFVRSFTESDQCSDPATRGALSLPHLAKITTPYGFVTLSQSPQMVSEEELFLQTGCRSWARDKINIPFTKQRVETKSNASGRSLSGQNQMQSNTDSHQVSRGVSHSETNMSSGSFPSSATAGTKQSFWGVLREHLSSRKLTKSI